MPKRMDGFTTSRGQYSELMGGVGAHKMALEVI
jgi:hypothetical protein